MQNNQTQSRPVALVTGASVRIGAAIARELHKAGYDVIVHYRQSRAEAESVADSLNTIRAGSAYCLQADLNDSDAVTSLAQQSLAWKQRLDVLVNNASTFYPKAFSQSTLEDWDALFNSNVKGAYFLSQQLLPALRSSNGVIINIGDANLSRLLEEFSIYQMAKAALTTMTQALAKELAPEVRVNAIAPGSILWSIHEDESQTDLRLSKIPLGRLGTPKDIAQAVVFLAQADYVTGHILAVDGGKSL